VLIVFEVVLRFAFQAPRNIKAEEGYGYRLLPNARVVTSAEGFARFTTNSHGLNDDEVLDAPPAFRTLLLGDSIALSYWS